MRQVIVTVRFKPGIQDVTSETALRKLHDSGYSRVGQLHVAKQFTLEFDETGLTENQLLAQAAEMCEQLLANAVYEEYSISLPKE